MTQSEIVKNLEQIEKLLEQDSPMIAQQRIKFLIFDINKSK